MRERGESIPMTRKKQNKRENDKRYYIVNKTRENMKSLGIYKKQFDPTIRRYANLRIEYEELEKSVRKNRKESEVIPVNALKLMKDIQKELLIMEDNLGLTPKGLKQLQKNSMEAPKLSLLEKVLMNGI